MARICFFEEREINEHEAAWRSNDIEKIQELADSFKEKPENELFAILNDINTSKKERNVDVSEAYSAFYINNALSMSVDCIQQAYYANLFMGKMSNQAHYNYLLHTVPQARRFSKWPKLVSDVTDKFIVAILIKRYNINEYDALLYKETLERKGKLSAVLHECRGFVTPDFLKEITKNVKEQKELKKLL